MTTRRTVLAAGLSAAALATSVTSANTQAAQRTFVLVHGGWHGGWCWRRVADVLRRQGHTVFTPTLTGLGERSHLMSRDIPMSPMWSISSNGRTSTTPFWSGIPTPAG
jgi:hypothetical protein